MKKIILLILVGTSLILLGSGIELEMKEDAKATKEKEILFYSDETNNKNYKTAKINLDQIKESTENKEEPKVVEQVIQDPVPIVEIKHWYNPTNHGYINSGMEYRDDGFHYGYDITSPYGSNEVVYPIADGVITGMFRDGAGANIISLVHRVKDKDYSSMYVHLSRYANGLYVGKRVTVNDPLGYMGQTGRATGVHLHLEVADCILFADNDYNCSSLSRYYNYLKRRYNEGFRGATTVFGLPSSWNER